MADSKKLGKNETPACNEAGISSFVFYKDWYDAIADLDDKTRLEVYDAIMSLVYNTEQKELSSLANMAMKFVRPQIERDIDKYLSIREKRSEAGKKHKGNQHSNLEQNGTNGTSVPFDNQNGTNETSDIKSEQNGTNGTININKNIDININKEDTDVSKKAAEASLADNKPLWKTSYEEYKRLFLEAKESLLTDNEFKEKQYTYYSNIDYEKSLEKSLDYWLEESTWKKVSRERAKTINPKERIKKNFDKNRIYKPFNGKSVDMSYPKSVDDVKSDDINSTWEYFTYWAEKNNVHELYSKIGRGFPEDDSQYQYLLKHTIGGARAFAYVVLVFARDGWKGYEDDRGFMWIYSNYIKANGLYTE